MSVNSASSESQFNINAANSGGESVYEFDAFRLDARRLMLYRDGEEVELAPKVVETLLALVENAGRIISKEELFERLWKDSFVDESNLTQNIYLLRKTLGNTDDGRPRIETFRRRGYRFNGEVHAQGVDGRYDTEPAASSISARTRSVALSRNGFGWLIGGAVAVISLAAAFFWYANSRPPASVISVSPPPNLAFTRLTPGMDAFYPAISPDGKQFAYCTSTSEGQRLWVKSFSGGPALALTPPILKSCNNPLFSRNGNEIFFVDHESKLVRIAISGGAPTPVLKSGPDPFGIAPDGRRVALLRDRELVVAGFDGSGEAVISKRDGDARWYSRLQTRPAWSPDGTRILISGGRIEKGQKRAELIEILAETGAERIIPTPDWFFIGDAVWSKDGHDIFVTVRERLAAPMQIWRISYPNGAVSRVTNTLESYDRLTISDDSRMMVAQKTVGACNIWLGSLRDPDSFKQITFDDGELTGRSGLAVTPDGNIVFTATYDGNQDIWHIGPDGAGLKQLTANAGDRNIQAVVTNGGNYIVYASRADGSNRRSIWRMNADGSGKVQLTNGPHEYPAVAPDGQWVYFSDITNKRSSIHRVSIDGGETFRVTGDHPADVPAVSPDGSMLAFIYGSDGNVADSGSLAILKLDGSAPPKIFDVQPFRAIFRWSLDGASILFIRRGSPNLWSQPLGGGPATQVTSLGVETAWNFALAPNSDMIAIARGNPAAEAVLVTNFR